MDALQVLHIEKRVSIAPGLNRHISREYWRETESHHMILDTWTPANADKNRTANNVELISRKTTDENGNEITLSLQQLVDRRIQQAGIKPRKGAHSQATSLEIIFSGSNERMNSMSREEVLQWSKDTMEWAKKEWGEDNVVYAALHLDETTPHIHMIVVPIVSGLSRRTKTAKKRQAQQGQNTKTYNINHEKLRLCANDVFTRGNLYRYHDSYAEEVGKKYGLKRGVRAEPGSVKVHTSSEDYNRQLAREQAELRALIAELQKDYGEERETVKEMEVKKESLISENADLNSELESKKDKIRQLQQLEEAISERQMQLQNLRSKGLFYLLQHIPDLICEDLTGILKIKIGGFERVTSFEEQEIDFSGSGKKEAAVKLNTIISDRKIQLFVSLSDGSVWTRTDRITRCKNDDGLLFIPEISKYFKAAITQETRAFVKSLYVKRPEPDMIMEKVREYYGSGATYVDSILLGPKDARTGALLHIIVDNKKKTVVHDRECKSFCVCDGHARKESLYYYTWETLDGKAATVQGNRVLPEESKGQERKGPRIGG